MAETKKRGTERRKEIKKISLDMNIFEFLDLPEFRNETREKNQKALKVITGLYYANEKLGIETLRDLKDYVKKNGWLGSRAYKIAMVGHMGAGTVEYFNKTLKKYGLDPFEPLYTR